MKTLARERDKQEILRRLATLRPDAERRWGRMSPHQAICHLNDSFRVMTGERFARPARVATLRLLPAAIKTVALWVPLRWPRGIPTMAEVDPQRGGTKPGTFSVDRADLQALIGHVTSNRFDGTTHPLFGRMSTEDWLRWGYLHVDHHLRQFGS